MWKYLLALIVLLSMGGAALACGDDGEECSDGDVLPDYCVDCFANAVIQVDNQKINTVTLGADEGDDAAVGNEGLSAGIIVTPKTVVGPDGFKTVAFAKIDQRQTQTIKEITKAKGVTENKAIHSAWLQGQGRKEKDEGEWYKEGALAMQRTTQEITKVSDYDCQDEARVFNADDKLAMIVDDLKQVIDISAKAKAATSDKAESEGTVTNNVDINVGPVAGGVA